MYRNLSHSLRLLGSLQASRPRAVIAPPKVSCRLGRSTSPTSWGKVIWIQLEESNSYQSFETSYDRKVKGPLIQGLDVPFPEKNHGIIQDVFAPADDLKRQVGLSAFLCIGHIIVEPSLPLLLRKWSCIWLHLPVSWCKLIVSSVSCIKSFCTESNPTAQTFIAWTWPWTEEHKHKMIPVRVRLRFPADHRTHLVNLLRAKVLHTPYGVHVKLLHHARDSWADSWRWIILLDHVHHIRWRQHAIRLSSETDATKSVGNISTLPLPYLQ